MRWLIALAAVLVFGWAALPQGASAGSNYCQSDVSEDGYIDMTDLVQFTARFGQAVPPGDRHDLMPLEAPNGFVDISDISYLTNVFGSECHGMWGMSIGGSPTSLNAPCDGKFSNHLVGIAQNHYKAVWHSAGIFCGSGLPPTGLRMMCNSILVQNPPPVSDELYDVEVAAWTGPVYMGESCIATGTGWVPTYQMSKGRVCATLWIEGNGQIIWHECFEEAFGWQALG